MHRASHTFVTLALAATAALLIAASPPTTSTADKVAWLTKNVVPVRSIEPRDNDYADLQQLRQSIGAARVVLLGGSHDVNVVKAKYRLVRFLHEEMGFDVLAISAPQFDGEQIDRALERGSLPSFDYDRATYDEFGYLGGPYQTLMQVDILKYARDTHKSGRPLHLAGTSPASTYAPHTYLKQLFRFVDRIDAQLAPPADRKAIQALLTSLFTGPRGPFGAPASSFPPSSPSVRRGSSGDRPLFPSPRPGGSQATQKVLQPGLAAVTRLLAGLGRVPSAGPDAHELALYRQTLSNLAVSAARRAGRPTPASPPDPLVWLATEWRPESKIVVWGSNESIIRNWSFPGRPRVTRGFGTAAYNIAFDETRTAAQVLEVLVAGPQPSLAPDGENLESLLHALGKPYSFLDFRSLPADHWLRRPLNARFINGAEVFPWPQFYDAVFNIDLQILKPSK